MKARIWMVPSLLLAAMASAANQPIVTKDWSFTNTGNGSAVASTSNDSGSTLGVYCLGAKNCAAYLQTLTACEDGAKYPVLVNSDSGASNFMLTCKNLASAGEKQNFVFVFDQFDALINLLLKDRAIGVAFPLAGGQFKVARFSLDGSNESLAAVNRVVTSGVKAVSGKQVKDETL
jgi:hypothetical protein